VEHLIEMEALPTEISPERQELIADRADIDSDRAEHEVPTCAAVQREVEVARLIGKHIAIRHRDEGTPPGATPRLGNPTRSAGAAPWIARPSTGRSTPLALG
jgi:hypothetical protein